MPCFAAVAKLLLSQAMNYSASPCNNPAIGLHIAGHKNLG